MSTSKDWTIALVCEIPKCDFCESDAEYDAATHFSMWAFMCQTHWKMHGRGELGIGRGQRLKLVES